MPGEAVPNGASRIGSRAWEVSGGSALSPSPNSNGGPLCREAKALAPSAWDWARGVKNDRESQQIRYQKALDIAVRAHRSVRAPAGQLDRPPPRARLLQNRPCPLPAREGRNQTAARHGLGDGEPASGIQAHRKISLPISASGAANWLHKAAANMVIATRKDWKEWQATKGKAASGVAKPAQAPR